MATNIPEEAISIHNDMVDELGENIKDQEFKKLKRLLEDVPLTTTDKRNIRSVQELFEFLMNKTFIDYGDYEILMSKLRAVKPSLCKIVQRHTEAIRKILKPESDDDISIFMYDTVYKTSEGNQAVFVDCTVYPVPDRICWKRDKTTPPKKKIPNDNRKYYYSPQSPTLIIRDPKKSMDEAQYQCWAEAKGTFADGEIVQVQVADTEPIKRTSLTSIQGPGEYIFQTTTSIPGKSADISQATTSIPRPSESISQTTANIPGPSEDISQATISIPRPSEESDENFEGSKHPTTGLEMLPQHRKRKRRKSDAQPYGERVIIDQGCRIAFDVTNEIDITRQGTENDIIDGFERATGVSGRVDEAKLKPKCIQVCIDISAATHPSEPSSIHLAEEVKHYLLDGGTIQLSDESQTVLQIDETSIQITPNSLPEDGTPYVNISHGEFTVPVGKTVILQTYVITSSEATSIQWFKVEDGDHIAYIFNYQIDGYLSAILLNDQIPNAICVTRKFRQIPSLRFEKKR